MGLVEKDWLTTLPTIMEEDVIYKDFVEEANRISKILREKDAELIIALTHMRAPNDELLARGAEDIDLILGGHDHEYYGVKEIGNSVVAKSGTDFRDLTVLLIRPGQHCLRCPRPVPGGLPERPPRPELQGGRRDLPPELLRRLRDVLELRQRERLQSQQARHEDGEQVPPGPRVPNGQGDRGMRRDARDAVLGHQDFGGQRRELAHRHHEKRGQDGDRSVEFGHHSLGLRLQHWAREEPGHSDDAAPC
ncbi:5'-nucleotidase, C-terminal domain-containing protein [Cryptosporidium felis]|nr:5'-nucleotidase, C-terminal domain-containing protein [Cryptosporidium felis]